MPELRESPLSQWEGAAVDTVHLTYRASLSVGGLDLAQELQGLIDAVGLAGGATPRNSGIHGFECGIRFAAGLELNWTDGNGSGPNAGYSSLQVKGDFLRQLGPEESAFVWLLLGDLRPYRCTRIDPQMTHANTLLVPEIIRLYRKGDLRTRQKKFFEPKGREIVNGEYPEGATLVHGSRKSENFARQYDKHLEEAAKGKADPGPPRRRDELELKGPLAQAVWSELLTLLTSEQDKPAPDWNAEARYCKGLIRHYLPIRDVSQWEGEQMPANWAGTAPEPAWWAAHFSEDAIRARRERGPSTTLLKRIGYMNRNFGSLYLQQHVLEVLKASKVFPSMEEAVRHAEMVVRDRFISNAKEQRLVELLENLPVADQDLARQLWWDAVTAAADGNEAERDWAESEKPRM